MIEIASYLQDSLLESYLTWLEFCCSPHQDAAREGELWDMTKVQAYLCLIKTLNPQITEAAAR